MTDDIITDAQDLSIDEIVLQQPSSEHHDTESALAVMQADMHKALQQRQHLGETGATRSTIVNEATAEPVTAIDIENLDESHLSRIIEMAWEDRTPFSAIEHSYGLSEDAVIKLMRQELKPSSFRLWRERVTGRATKHQAKRGFEVGRAYCKTQYKQR